jgi:hypothetical protein
MTQRLIYGKTIKIEGDSLAFDGTTFMDPFDDTGVVPPMAFSNTAYDVYTVTFGGQTGSAVGGLICSRNNLYRSLSMRADVNLSVLTSGTSLTLQIPSVTPQTFYPSQTIHFLINLWNGSAPAQFQGTISNTGLVTISGLTTATTYTFRYGLTPVIYGS